MRDLSYWRFKGMQANERNQRTKRCFDGEIVRRRVSLSWTRKELYLRAKIEGSEQSLEKLIK
jgi:hypothetical protein